MLVISALNFALDSSTALATIISSTADPLPIVASLLAAVGALALGMAGRTKIEWAEQVWNPTTGCDTVSRGCQNCYMFRDIENRLIHHPKGKYVYGTPITLQPQSLGDMERVLDPAKVFVNSMSDLFHEGVPDEYVFEVFEAMARAPWHLYMILTKRDARLRELGPSLPWADHVMMGVSVEKAKSVGRIDALRESGATRTFVSFEPLVGSVVRKDEALDLDGIDLAIVGGESGPTEDVDRMQPKWAREIRDACEDQDVAFFFKQWGRYNEAGDPVGKKKAGRVLDGEKYDGEPAWYPKFVREARLRAAAERVRRSRN